MVTEVQRKILQCLREVGDEYSVFYSYIESHTDIPRETLKKEMRGLLRAGYVDHNKGLMDDDGFLAGSGFALAYGKWKEVDEILEAKA